MSLPRSDSPVRWGLLGASRIAVREFLPALRATAGGTAALVGARDGDRATAFAAEHGVARGVQGYQEVLDSPDVDAVYVALPNDMHTRWAEAAARAGKAVLCEKPLGLSQRDVSDLVSAVGPGALVWEAMVFPFHPQSELLRHLIQDELGGLSHVDSQFHFVLERDEDIRWDPQRGGGAMYDVGCYCVRLGRLAFGSEPTSADAQAVLSPRGVDASVSSAVHFPGGRVLSLSASLVDPLTTWACLEGPRGRLSVDNPFHPKPGDGIELWRDGRLVRSFPAPPGRSFGYGLTHIHRVLRGEEEPRNLAEDESVGQARAMDLVRAAAGL